MRLLSWIWGNTPNGKESRQERGRLQGQSAGTERCREGLHPSPGSRGPPADLAPRVLLCDLALLSGHMSALLPHLPPRAVVGVKFIHKFARRF